MVVYSMITRFEFFMRRGTRRLPLDAEVVLAVEPPRRRRDGDGREALRVADADDDVALR